MRNFLKKRCHTDKMSREKYLTARALRIFHIDICAIYQIEREKRVMLIRKTAFSSQPFCRCERKWYKVYTYIAKRLIE